MGFRVCPPWRMPREDAEQLLTGLGLIGFTWKVNKDRHWTQHEYYYMFSDRVRVLRDADGERFEYVPSALITEERRRTLTQNGWLVVHTSAFNLQQGPGRFWRG